MRFPQRVERMEDGRLYVELSAPAPKDLHGMYVRWPGVGGETVSATMERQVVETDKALYALYTPRLTQVTKPKRRGLMRFAR